MAKFTKIRKWAEENGYMVEDKKGYSSREEIKVVINNELWFELSMRESTIYQSIRGQRGDCAGLYLRAERRPNGKWMRGYSFHQRTQQDAINSMERDIEDQEKT